MGRPCLLGDDNISNFVLFGLRKTLVKSQNDNKNKFQVKTEWRRALFICFSPFLDRKRKIREYLTCFSVPEKKKTVPLESPFPWEISGSRLLLPREIPVTFPGPDIAL